MIKKGKATKQMWPPKGQKFGTGIQMNLDRLAKTLLGKVAALLKPLLSLKLHLGRMSSGKDGCGLTAVPDRPTGLRSIEIPRPFPIKMGKITLGRARRWPRAGSGSRMHSSRMHSGGIHGGSSRTVIRTVTRAMTGAVTRAMTGAMIGVVTRAMTGAVTRAMTGAVIGVVTRAMTRAMTGAVTLTMAFQGLER